MPIRCFKPLSHYCLPVNYNLLCFRISQMAVCSQSGDCTLNINCHSYCFPVLTHVYLIKHMVWSLGVFTNTMISNRLTTLQWHFVYKMIHNLGSSITLDRSTTYPKFDPTGVSNSWPPDHDSTVHVTEMPALTTRLSVTCFLVQLRTEVPHTPSSTWPGFRTHNLQIMTVMSLRRLLYLTTRPWVTSYIYCFVWIIMRCMLTSEE